MQDENNINNPENNPDEMPDQRDGGLHNESEAQENVPDGGDTTNTEVSGDDRFFHHARKISQITRLSLLLSLVAFVGLIFLLVSPGSRKSQETTYRAQPVAGSHGETGAGTRIAFVRADSVQENYLMTIHFLDSIERRFKSMEQDLMSKKNDYEKKVHNYYRDIQSGLLKESGALQIKEKLENEGDNLAKLEENYANRINELQLQLNIIYFDSLWNFIDRHKADFGVDMVVGYQQGLTNIFFADASLDLTKQVIDLMNNEYIERYPDRKNLSKRKK